MTEHMGTTCVQGGYRPGDAEPRQIPIYQSTRPTTMLLRRFARWRAALLQC